jgi:hypothetical protein
MNTARLERGEMVDVKAAASKRGEWMEYCVAHLKEGETVDVTAEMAESLADLALEVSGLKVR